MDKTSSDLELHQRNVRLPRWVDDELELLADSRDCTVVQYLVEIATNHVEENAKILHALHEIDYANAKQKLEQSQHRLAKTNGSTRTNKTATASSP